MEQFLVDAVKFFQEHLLAQVAIIGMVVDFALRLAKTDKPIDIMRVISRVLKLIGELCVVAAQFLDKVLPQRLSDKAKADPALPIVEQPK